MLAQYQDFLIRDWQPIDRQIAADLIFSVLTEYGLQCDRVYVKRLAVSSKRD